METKEYTLYHFDELNEGAKENARRNFNFLMDSWEGEYRTSLNKFCDMLGVTLKDWEVQAFGPIDYTLDRRQIHEAFRGKKKRDLLTLPQCFTGFCADEYLMETFKFGIKAGHTPYDAIDAALYAFFKAWRDDMESSTDDENIADFCDVNNIVFFENGDIAPT